MLSVGGSMAAKLHINLSQGVLELEGDPDFVREIYSDFKVQLLDRKSISSSMMPGNEEQSSAVDDHGKIKARPRRRTAPKVRNSGEDSGSGVNVKAPKLDKNLDTANLLEFYKGFEPKNNSEKILIFLKFINDILNIDNANTDQIYTCYKKTGEKIPSAYAQAFHDASSKHGYIDFNSASDIKVTISGDNHFNLDIKKKNAE